MSRDHECSALEHGSKLNLNVFVFSSMNHPFMPNLKAVFERQYAFVPDKVVIILVPYISNNFDGLLLLT